MRTSSTCSLTTYTVIPFLQPMQLHLQATPLKCSTAKWQTCQSTAMETCSLTMLVSLARTWLLVTVSFTPSTRFYRCLATRVQSLLTSQRVRSKVQQLILKTRSTPSQVKTGLAGRTMPTSTQSRSKRAVRSHSLRQQQRQQTFASALSISLTPTLIPLTIPRRYS